jgi:hypothetical protein
MPSSVRDVPPIEGRYANCFQVGFNDVEFIFEFGQESEQQASIHTRVIVSPVNVPPFLRLATQAWKEYQERRGGEQLES